MTNRLRLWTTRYQSGRKGEEPGGWVMWAMTCLHTGLNTDKNSEHWRSVSFPEWRDSEYRHTFMLRGWQKPEFGTLLDFPYFTSCCHNKAATVSTALAMCPASPSHYATWGRYARTLLHSQLVELRVALRTPGFVAGVWSEVFFFFFFLREGKGRRKRGRETSMCGWLLYTPYWGPSPQPRHVPWLGIELVTLWFAGRHSITETHQPGLKRSFVKGSALTLWSLAYFG